MATGYIENIDFLFFIYCQQGLSLFELMPSFKREMTGQNSRNLGSNLRPISGVSRVSMPLHSCYIKIKDP